MAVLTDVRDHIKADMKIQSSIYDTNIENSIRTSLRELEQSKYWFLEKSDTVTLTNTFITVDVPSDFGAGGTYALVDGTTRRSHGKGFDLVGYDVLERDYWNEYPVPSGTPQACALFGSKIYASHTADQDYTLILKYYQKTTGMPGTSNETIWFDEGYDVVRSKAQYIFKRDSMDFTAQDSDGDMAKMHMISLNERHQTYEQGRAI